MKIVPGIHWSGWFIKIVNTFYVRYMTYVVIYGCAQDNFEVSIFRGMQNCRYQSLSNLGDSTAVITSGFQILNSGFLPVFVSAGQLTSFSKFWLPITFNHLAEQLFVLFQVGSAIQNMVIHRAGCLLLEASSCGATSVDVDLANVSETEKTKVFLIALSGSALTTTAANHAWSANQGLFIGAKCRVFCLLCTAYLTLSRATA